MSRSRILSLVLVYAAIAAALLFANKRTRVDIKPFFSLSTNRTYGTSENACIWLDHRGIESLDFRVYRVEDPLQFFSQLSNPHQIGYGHVPSLNPNQLVTTWREQFSLSNDYDRRMISLGKQENGVYLVEAAGVNLRAYTVVVITELAMVEKASANGELLVYAVDRKTGEPREDAQVEIVKSKKTLASGRTNSDGIFRTKTSTDDDDANFVVLASYQDNFAISDLESSYFRSVEEGNLDIAEHEKPEYKVNISTPNRFIPAGTKTKFKIDARYFSGEYVAGAEVKYYIYRSRYYAHFESEETYEDDFINEGDGKLDAYGHLEITFDVPASTEKDVADYEYRLEAQITDSSKHTIDSSATLIATRGSVIAGAIPDRYFIHLGQTAKITVKTTDYEGHPVPAKVTLKFVRDDIELSSAEVSTDQQGHAVYDYEVTTPGNISIKTVVHENGKQFVSLGDSVWVVSPDYQYNESTIKLVADKKSYRAGEIAHVLAILPQDNVNLLITTERENVLSAWKLKATGQTIVIDVPVEKHYTPNVFLSVTFVKDDDLYTNDQRLVIPARDGMRSNSVETHLSVSYSWISIRNREWL